MHKGHLLGCAIGLATAVALMTMAGATPSSWGVLVAVLACPIAMVVAMRVLMGGHDHGTTGEDRTPAPHAATHR